jgi:hypothetical protein
VSPESRAKLYQVVSRALVYPQVHPPVARLERKETRISL